MQENKLRRLQWFLWPFNDRRLAIQTTVVSAGSLRLAPGSKYSNLIRLCQYSIACVSVITSQMELKFVNNSYFKKLFQNLRPKLQYSKNRIFVTSHFGTLFSTGL